MPQVRRTKQNAKWAKFVCSWKDLQKENILRTKVQLKELIRLCES